LLLIVLALSSYLATVGIAATLAPEWAARQLAELDEPDMVTAFGGMSRTLLAVNIAVVGPVVEELVFRGLLLRRWVATRGFWPGILWSSALFAVLHPHMWLGAMAFGIMTALLYLWSRSLLVPILVHVLNNGLVVLVLLSDAGDEGAAAATTPAQALAEVRSEWPMAVVMLLLAAALLFALARPLVHELRLRMALAPRS
jgi:membrane protease YdiL (CAAX protease family)